MCKFGLSTTNKYTFFCDVNISLWYSISWKSELKVKLCCVKDMDQYITQHWKLIIWKWCLMTTKHSDTYARHVTILLLCRNLLGYIRKNNTYYWTIGNKHKSNWERNILGGVVIWHVSWENRPLQGSEHCYTWAVMAKVLSSTSNQGISFLNGCRITCYFDIKFTAVVLIEPILQKFKDLKNAHFLEPWRGLFSYDTLHIWIYGRASIKSRFIADILFARNQNFLYSYMYNIIMKLMNLSKL